ncbi:carboxylesterase family protein [Amycolatopsis sp. OK19-0408]|uniref:Carboxylic ester hydrolase n=1 Tax=Amycolatopsis iheyensis TaxID=2945988 RepID=A0A9X2NGU0_9PSEU|nr:carboxylesterase family protein [Amycolatopsis iheyensis]MCR6488459.1 carboxylesterase family protein [Amycolatopsis iheyensis]
MSGTTVEIVTPHGRLRGVRRANGSCAFLGVPYAEPPVGERRFAAPVPHRGWAGVRDATTPGATPQRRQLAEVTLIPEPSIPGESTLNVDVFTPDPGPARDGGLPVLVWIHGGGFVAGSPASPWYDGAAFNRDGVVTVSVSYRLGFDGFGRLDDAPGNRGVLDWLCALEWVRDTISAFGGDPRRVTIAGQSAGGAAVLTLLGMPSAQQLFTAAHCLSGPAVHITTGQAESFGRALAGRLGVPPSRAGLSTVDETRILAAQRELAPLGEAPADPVAAITGLTNGLVLGPVVDGDLLPESTVDSLRAGRGADKPLVLGATEHEFAFGFARARERLADIPATALLSAAGVPESTASGFVAAHPGLDTADLIGRYVTDRLFGVAAAETADARGTAPTWLYRFAWPSPVFGQAVHCLDVPFYFDCLGADGVSAVAGPRPPQELASEVHAAAVGLITAGDPGWPAGEVRVFGGPSAFGADTYRAARALLVT